VYARWNSPQGDPALNAERPPDQDLIRAYSRRKVLGVLGTAGTLGPYIVAQDFISAAASEPTAQLASAIGQAVGPRRLDSAPSEVLDEFMAARPGVLIPYYQLFWPIHRDKNALHDLTELSAQALASATSDGRQFRLRVLPALAHIHALGSPLPDERPSHEAFVLRTLQTAIDEVAQSDRIDSSVGILEAIWRTMIAALIRNKDSWTTFRVETELLKEAAVPIEQYLSGQKLLFAPTTLAWQFLLTYETATRERAYDKSQLQRVQGIIASIEKHTRHPSYWWFGQLRALLQKRRSFERILPQASEVFMGHVGNQNDRFTNDYFMAAHLERVYLNSIVYAGLREEDRPNRPATEIEEASLRVPAAYGVTPVGWHRLRQLSKQGDTGLSSEAIEYWDLKYSTYDKAFSDPAHRIYEEARAKHLSQWLPFRTHDQEVVTRRSWGSLDEAIKAFVLFGLRGVWLQSALFEGSTFAEARGLEIPKSAILDKVDAIIEDKLPKHAEAAGNFLEELGHSSGGVSGWTSTKLDTSKLIPPEVLLRSRHTGASSIPPATEEGSMVSRSRERVSIPPGSYTRETLPPLSKGAKRILDELQVEAQAEANNRPQDKRAKYHEKLVGIRLVDKLK
jgi:hypothetical protein